LLIHRPKNELYLYCFGLLTDIRDGAQVKKLGPLSGLGNVHDFDEIMSASMSSTTSIGSTSPNRTSARMMSRLAVVDIFA
jgi:hypothetical protein